MTIEVAHAVLGLLFENSAEIALVVDRATGRVLCANLPAAELLACAPDQLEGQPLADLLHEPRALEAAGHYEEIALRRSDGYPVYVDLDLVHVDHPLHGGLVAMIARDTTERRTLQLELLAKHSALIAAHAELERAHGQLGMAKAMLEERNREIAMLAWRAAMGELVAGIAHHLNNPVAALTSTVGRLRGKLAATGPDRTVETERLLDRMLRIAARIEFNVGEIVRVSRAVAHGQTAQPLPPELSSELSSFTEQLDNIPTKETP